MNSLVPIREPLGNRDDIRRRRFKPLIIIVSVGFAAAAGAFVVLRREPASAAAPPANVPVAKPLARRITEWDDYVGRFEASRVVEVRPRVSGQVEAVHFVDGAVVRTGQLLYTLDKRPFAAAVSEARAAVESASSELALARADLERADQLTGDDAVSAAELDRLRARASVAAAAVSGARARLQARSLELAFTEVRAPISGRVSNRRVDAGNQVSGGEGATGTLLTTVNALDPIYFSFDASEALFLKAKRGRQAGAGSTDAEIRLQDEEDYRWSGKLDFTDNGLNPRSGTIRLRAVLRNPQNFLTPGMFGNMRLASAGVSTALLVPESAVQTDQTRKFVLAVDRAGSVVSKPVQLGPVIDGLRIIRTGIDPEDRIVVGATQSAVPGAKVTATAGRITPHPAPVATPVAPLNGIATFAP